MPGRSATRRGWWLGALVALVVVAVLVLLVREEPARVSAVEPSNGAALTVGPAEVALVFTRVPQPREMHLTVVGPGGTVVTRGVPTLVDRRAVAPVAVARAGLYRVAYHVVLADGHQESGSSQFTVGLAVPMAGSAPGADVGPVAAGDTGHEHLRRDNSTLVLLTLDLLMIGVVVVLVLRRPRRRGRPDSCT